jgi:hypothetical protein
MTHKFKNTQDLFHPQIGAFVKIHGYACKELMQDYPSPSREAELLDIILDSETKFPILREFRETYPELHARVEVLTHLGQQAD